MTGGTSAVAGTTGVGGGRKQSGRKVFWRVILKITLLAAFWLAFEFFDPLSLERAMRAESEHFFPAIAAPFYGFPKPVGQQDIAIVLDTDQTLDALNHAWPIRYADHARILNGILAAKPKAIFFDIVIPSRPRPEDNLSEFGPVIAQAKRQHVPLYFAQGRFDQSLPDPLSPYGVITAWNAPADTYPLIENKSPTAALKIYQDLCSRNFLDKCAWARKQNDLFKPLYVRWGSTYDSNERYFSAGCTDPRRSTLGRLWNAAGLGMRALSDKFARPPSQCYYHVTVPAECIAKGINGNCAIGISQAGAMVRNRVVFYGADVTGSHDVVVTSTLGGVAGVSVHAMALDNLITYGNNYFSAWKKNFMQPPDLLTFGIWMLLSTAVVFRLDLLPQFGWFPGVWSGIPRRIRAALTGTGIFAAALFLVVADYRERGIAAPFLPFLPLFVLDLVLVGIVVWAGANWHRLIETMPGRIALAAVLIAALFALNELFIKWPPSDWFAVVVLLLFIRENLHGIPKQLRHGTHAILHMFRRRRLKHAHPHPHEVHIDGTIGEKDA